jgi:hypothetical protein
MCRIQWKANCYIITWMTGTGCIAADPCGHGIEPCMSSWADLAGTSETLDGYPYCYLLPEGKRDQTRTGGANCAAPSDRADCDPYFCIPRPWTALIMTANLSSSVSAVCRPVMICWTVVINVTYHRQCICRPLARLCSCDDGCQLEEFPARGLLQLRRRISLENSSGSEVVTTRCLRASIVQLSPLEPLDAATSTVAAGVQHLCRLALLFYSGYS